VIYFALQVHTEKIVVANRGVTDHFHFLTDLQLAMATRIEEIAKLRSELADEN